MGVVVLELRIVGEVLADFCVGLDHIRTVDIRFQYVVFLVFKDGNVLEDACVVLQRMEVRFQVLRRYGQVKARAKGDVAFFFQTVVPTVVSSPSSPW